MNTQESGRGYFLEIQGPRMFFAGYFYDNDGRATWLVSNDPMPNPDFYAGRLLAFRDGQSLLGTYRHPGAPTDAGAITLAFTDDSHGTLTWPGGSVAIERYRFEHGDDSDTPPPMTGWWWNPDESGRGFSMEEQGDHMFIAAYMYDASGNPLWYVADALMQSPTLFSGALLQFANGQTLGGAYRTPTPPLNAGTLTVQFTDADHASVTLSDEPKTAGDSLPKQFKQFVVTPVRLQIAPIERSERLVGSFSQVMTFPGNVNNLRIEVNAANVTWQQDEGVTGLNGEVVYEINHALALASIRGTLTQRNLEGVDEHCSVVGGGAHNLTAAEGRVFVRADGRFSGQISFLITLTYPCWGTETVNPIFVTIPLSGTFNTVMKGSPRSPSVFTATTSEYRFIAGAF